MQRARRFGRRRPWLIALAALGVLAALLAGSCRTLYREIGGDFLGPPEDLSVHLSEGARAFLEERLASLESRPWIDFHVHLLGVGADSSGIELHPDWLGSWNPIVRGRSGVYLSAAGLESYEHADSRHVGRIVALLRASPSPARALVYAMDRRYREDGTVDVERTDFYVPNDWAWRSAAAHAELLVPVVSIHPYRADALEALDRWIERGARFLKWLPNAQGIDPSRPGLEPFYDRLREGDVTLLSHTGRELALGSAQDQALGNPLLLRAALDRGVRVVALHAASDGEDLDLDSAERPRRASFDLLLRLLADPRYEGLFFAEISAITFEHHLPRPLATLLEREDLHRRLVHGSDYPLVGIDILTRTSTLSRLGFLTLEEASWLNEIYAYNPLLFDLLLKRTVRHPESGARFADEVFLAPDALRQRVEEAARALAREPDPAEA